MSLRWRVWSISRRRRRDRVTPTCSGSPESSAAAAPIVLLTVFTADGTARKTQWPSDRSASFTWQAILASPLPLGSGGRLAIRRTFTAGSALHGAENAVEMRLRPGPIATQGWIAGEAMRNLAGPPGDPDRLQRGWVRVKVEPAPVFVADPREGLGIPGAVEPQLAHVAARSERLVHGEQLQEIRARRGGRMPAVPVHHAGQRRSQGEEVAGPQVTMPHHGRKRP